MTFFAAFASFTLLGPCVTVFGSARTKSDSRYYELARKMGAAIAQLGFTVMTGGGEASWKRPIAARKMSMAVR